MSEAIIAENGEEKKVLAIERLPSKHSGVIAFFNKEYLKEEILERKLSVIIKNSAFLREKSDYDDFFIASRKDAEKQLEDASIFLEKLETYIKQQSKQKW